MSWVVNILKIQYNTAYRILHNVYEEDGRCPGDPVAHNIKRLEKNWDVRRH